MKAYCITLLDNHISETGRDILKNSSDVVGNNFDILTYPAITPNLVSDLMEHYHLTWTYPWEGIKLINNPPLKLKAYTTADPLKRVACAFSHYLLWDRCAKENEPFLIFEHDAVFTNKFDPEIALKSKYKIIGINNPYGATRKANIFDYEVLRNIPDEFGCIPCPIIDEMHQAQGIAGNSAYLIKPEAAKSLWGALREYGCWPNDALMCQQLFPWIGVTKKYYTKVQGLPSTTTL